MNRDMKKNTISGIAIAIGMVGGAVGFTWLAGLLPWLGTPVAVGLGLVILGVCLCR